MQWVIGTVTVEYNQSQVVSSNYATSFNTVYGGVCSINKGFSAYVSLDSITTTSCEFCIRSNTSNTQTNRPFAVFLIGK